jgi:hypothetical protein
MPRDHCPYTNATWRRPRRKTCPLLFDVDADGSKVVELIAQVRWLADMGIQTVFRALRRQCHAPLW